MAEKMTSEGEDENREETQKPRNREEDRLVEID